jgi:hypothetical protein
MLLPLTRAIQFYPFTYFILSQGIPLASALESHGLSLRMLDEADLFVDENRFQEMATRISHKEGIPQIGYILGWKMRLSDLGRIGILTGMFSQWAEGL